MDIRILQKENKELDDCFQLCIEDPFDKDDGFHAQTSDRRSRSGRHHLYVKKNRESKSGLLADERPLTTYNFYNSRRAEVMLTALGVKEVTCEQIKKNYIRKKDII